MNVYISQSIIQTFRVSLFFPFIHDEFDKGLLEVNLVNCVASFELFFAIMKKDSRWEVSGNLSVCVTV